MTICIETALKAEAQPLIEALNLKPLSGNHLFPIWENQHIKLIISGVGKIKAGAACSYLAGIYQDEDIYGWLNVGIGGHRSLPVGTPLLAHKVIDDTRRSSYFPSFTFPLPCQTEECRTVENPENTYGSQAIYDMEAAGFYAIASKISPLEMIHVFKVISDNQSHPTSEVSKKGVEKLISKHIDIVKKVLEELSVLIEEIAPFETPLLEEFLKKWHFTTCETYSLKKLLKRWQALCPDQVLFSQDLTKQKSAKQVLTFMENHLNAVPLGLT